jgi:hypothetical protein
MEGLSGKSQENWMEGAFMVLLLYILCLSLTFSHRPAFLPFSLVNRGLA